MVKKSFIIHCAHKEALKSSMKTQYGCIIIHRNKIVGSGYNYCVSGHQKSCIL